MNREWNHQVSITGFRDADPSDFPALARTTYEALEPIEAAYPGDEELEAIRDDFHTLGFIEGGSASDFDESLRRLYDWGDIGKRLWIGTP